MILSGAVEYVRERLQAFASVNKMTDGKNLSVLDALIISELNLAQEKAVAYTKIYRGAKRPYLIPTVKKQSLYDKPTGLIEVEYVKYSRGYRSRDLEKVERRYLPAWQKVSSKFSPLGYDDHTTKGKIKLYPAPKYDGELIQIFGFYLPPKLTADSEEFYIPDPYSSGLCDLAVSKILRGVFGTDAAFKAADDAENRYKENVEACRLKFAFTGNGSRFVKNTRTGGVRR